MEPTLHCARSSGDKGCEAKYADTMVEQESGAKGLRRGDLIVFHLPRTAVGFCKAAKAGNEIDKRVIGLAGDRVTERNGLLWVNGRRIKDAYVTPGNRGRHSGRWAVKAKTVFVAGDNRAISCDSRYWGFVPTSSVIGKIVEIIRYGKDGNRGPSPPVVHVKYPYTANQVGGPIMEPTLRCARPKRYCDGRFPDLVLVALSGARDIQRGDVITFRTPRDGAIICGGGGPGLARVVGLPGDRLVEERGVFFANGRPLNEPYISQRYRDRMSGHWSVPPGSYFVMDDLRNHSCDSRYWGSVKASRVLGRIVEVIRPPG